MFPHTFDGPRVSRGVYGSHHGRWIEVVEQRTHTVKSNGPEQLFVVQGSVGLGELGVPLVRKLPFLLIEWHNGKLGLTGFHR